MKELRPELKKLSTGERLYQLEKPIIALTGGIATGKSTVSRLLEEKGIRIIDADKLVKDIYKLDETKAFIRNEFSEAWRHGEIDFKKLRELVFSDKIIKSKVEAFIYARLPEAFKAESSKIKDQNFYFYDVPLLFERQIELMIDVSVVVYAPRKVQLARLINRDGSAEDIGNKILDQQMDIEIKKQKADFVVTNSGSMTELAAEVDQLLLQILI